MNKFLAVLLIAFTLLSLTVFFSACEEMPPTSDLETAIEAATRQKTPENYLTLSLKYYEGGQYEKSINAAQEALKLKPDYAPAYNNICAAYNNLAKYDEGIAACQEALKLDPEFQLAKNNLQWALAAKQPKQNR